jgi:hypothetical protein
MKTPAIYLLLALGLLAGCHNTTTPTSTESSPYFALDVFTGTLSPRAVGAHGFNVQQDADVAITLIALMASGTNTAVPGPVALRLGTFGSDGTTCNGAATASATPALTVHLTQQLTIGAYCVAVVDEGGLSGSADYAVRVQQSANVVALGRAGTERFSSNLYIGGALHRTFATAERGDIRVSLKSVLPAAAIAFGLGASSDGSTCYLHKTTITTPGEPAELSATAEAGAYCVKVFDPGGLADRVVFDIEIAHP